MPFSKKQREYFDNANHRWNFKTGAVRSGKTYADYFVIPKRIRERAGKEGLAVILGVTSATIERNLLDPMRQIWGAELVGNIGSTNQCWLFGEKVYCLGAEKVSQVSKIRGASIKYLYGDEVADWSKEVFEIVKSRLDKPYSCFDGALNPKGPRHWLKEFLDTEGLDIYNQEYTLFDNPFLPSEFIENLCKEYKGTVYYERYVLGQWALAEGLAYPMYDNTVPTEDRDYSKFYISMDYGIQNPTAMILWGYHDGRWYAIREYYHSGRETNDQHTDQQYYEALEQLAGDLKIERVIIDPSAASFITLVEQKKRFKILDADNAVIEGIQHVAQCLNERKILFNDRCKRTIQEFGLYRWDEKAKEDRPIKDNDHCLTGDTLVDTVDGARRIDELIGVEGKVYCTDGKKARIGRFHSVRQTQEKAEVYEVCLKDGKAVKATAEHPFLTKRGWVKLKNLRTDDEIACIGGCRNESGVQRGRENSMV